MRLIPIGITEKDGEFPLLAKASDFSTDHYDGIQVRKRRDGNEKARPSASKFLTIIDKYESFDHLTITMLNEFIDKILVHERERKNSVETTQEVEIYFNFIGRYVPPHFGEVTLTPEEQEVLRLKEARKDKLHQDYLRRKAEGKYQAYRDKTKSAIKEQIDAKKAVIRAEDMARGVFIPVSQLPKAEPMKGELRA